MRKPGPKEGHPFMGRPTSLQSKVNPKNINQHAFMLPTTAGHFPLACFIEFPLAPTFQQSIYCFAGHLPLLQASARLAHSTTTRMSQSSRESFACKLVLSIITALPNKAWLRLQSKLAALLHGRPTLRLVSFSFIFPL